MLFDDEPPDETDDEQERPIIASSSAPTPGTEIALQQPAWLPLRRMGHDGVPSGMVELPRKRAREREQTVADFVFGQRLDRPSGSARGAISHRPAQRDESEVAADDHKWDERAPKALYESVPEKPLCKFFLSAAGCPRLQCRFSHVLPVSSEGPPRPSRGQ
mmetsp:Transcript_10611/g.27511  ORF Transcript_10611/g.27511 Transcript_10611/m.27511 type:complete len:161 (-) Transcript_10611:156-638(-)